MSASDQWDGGFVGQFTIVNNTGMPIENWSMVMEAGFLVTNAWNAVLVEQQDGSVELQHEQWNGTIEDGQSIEFGFQGSGNFQLPASVTVNGNPAEPG